MRQYPTSDDLKAELEQVMRTKDKFEKLYCDANNELTSERERSKKLVEALEKFSGWFQMAALDNFKHAEVSDSDEAIILINNALAAYHKEGKEL